jgi:signal transduction histidine kinase
VITLSDVRALPLFDGMPDAELSALVAAGDEVRFAVGENAWTEGEPADSWWVLVDGALDLVRRSGPEETVVGHFDAPGRWAGGFRAWDEHGVYLATGRGTAPGRLLRVPATVLHEVVARYPLVSHVIDGVFHTARTIEVGARQRDALVTLGRLSAGLAHEINNPAAAAARSADALGDACVTLLSSLRRLADGEISAEQFGALDELRLALEVPSGTPVDALGLADCEDALSDWMDEHGVDQSWTLAPTLAAAGADARWCARVSEVLPEPTLGAGLQWVASTIAAQTLLTEVREATGRVSDLVAAVKAYSHMDRAAMQRTRVTDGLDTTLVMFGHRLKEGVTVVRDYAEDLPEIEAYAGELNQVWTNLIDNALDAMGHEGTLSVTARAEGEDVVVEIGDTGPGMPPDVAARAFDAFFTTKDVGEGTGLGLYIARRIVVERHRGEISVTSPSVDGDPSRGTVVVVRLRGTHERRPEAG